MSGVESIDSVEKYKPQPSPEQNPPKPVERKEEADTGNETERSEDESIEEKEDDYRGRNIDVLA